MKVHHYKCFIQRIRPTDRFMRVIVRRDVRGWIIVRRELMPK